MKAILLFVLLLSITASNTKPRVRMTPWEISKFIEGLLEGIILQRFPDLSGCIGEVDEVEQQIYQGVIFIEQETFSGIKNGLLELGKAVENVPKLVK